MNGERRGLGFIIWTLVWAVIGGFLLVQLAAAGDCDTSLNKFCSLGVLIYGALAIGAGLVWLVGMAIGAMVVMLSRPSRPSCCPVCGAPHDPGTSTCAACGRSLREGDP